MNKRSHDTAILIFSKPSEKEGNEKVLIPQNQTTNKSSLKWLRNRTLQVVQATRLPSFLIEEQTGNTFGQRLANAFQCVFDQGYQHVIAIGNDCVELCEADLIEAARLVSQGEVVLGPDLRNGTYLIGLNRTQFNASRLAQLPWQSRDTFKSLVEHFGVCQIMETKQDLNHRQDLENYVQRAARKIRKIFHLLLSATMNWADSKMEPHTSSYHLVLAHRGPPQRF
ncbi:MAG: DUF2064 domain-containing protein [Reichenbachiella sp.]|uniref:TIGR04282 family arsenosugar biosynthesis glycosyltransferase n=1 Tax=Reichenbachiella sp. TaxID=2184521 RepID=UPI003263DEBF